MAKAMERGLLWLPLLIVFIGLAWAGWNEYQKVEAYKIWAQRFQKAKYDIRAVLGLKDQTLTWGMPTRRGVTAEQTIALNQIQGIHLRLDGALVDASAPPQQARRIFLELQLLPEASVIQIPFTEVGLAAAWTRYLQQCLEQAKSEQP